MRARELSLKGAFLIEMQSFTDDRGLFVERYNQQKFDELGFRQRFVQDNFSVSKPGVIRGLHYQVSPPQAKLVTVMRGSIFDVIVDIRRESPTFGQFETIELQENDNKMIFIPAGMAHGFCVTSSIPAEVFYKVDQLWNPEGERGIN